MIEIGFGDFGETFETERERRRRALEREHTEQLLRLIDELQRSSVAGDGGDGAIKSSGADRVERLHISGNGDIVRDDDDVAGKKHIMGVDDLPRESEFEMIFGKQPENDPGIRVFNGRRLFDGKAVQRVQLDEKLDFFLSGVRFETLVFVLLVVGLVLLVRFRLWRRSDTNDRDFENLVEREVRRRLLLRL